MKSELVQNVFQGKTTSSFLLFTRNSKNNCFAKHILITTSAFYR